MTLTPGSRLGIYEIVSAIGAGGMGEVYRARDTRLGREVAVKVLPEAVASNAARLARFEREAKTVAALNHPNIVVLHSIEEAQGTHFLTMELVEGQTLDRLVTPGGLPLPRVLDLVIPLADALVAAHEKGVVHRDLKPANVMVTREGRVKVLDFGLARTAPADSDLNVTQAMTMESPISGEGLVLGTVPYMAPEQVRGEPVDALADLFSFGILVYELATGRRPFVGETLADVSSSILRDAAPAVRTLRADLPRDLERIIGRCLEKSRDQRFQTAKDVRNELEIVRRETASSSGTSTPARPAAASGTTEAPSIAVLPFANRSRDEEDEYFSDGLADELLSVLGKIRGLRVAARSSSGSFKGRNVTIGEVGRALNVATVLEGSVRKAGNRVRISVQLVKVEDGYHLWSETYDRTLEDIFAVQDDIAQSVVKELRAALLGQAPDSEASGEAKAAVAVAARGRGENAEAHRLYLQGKHFVERMSEADTIRGKEYLEAALKLDPSHAPAWVVLSRAHVVQGGFGWAPVIEAYAKAKEAVARALELAPDLPEAHVMLTQIRRMHDWDWNGARESSRRALELAPGSAEVLAEAAILAHNLNRLDEALDLFRRAVEQDPLSSRTYGQLGSVYRAMKRLPEAEQAYRKSLELSPQRIASHSMVALLLAQQGRDVEALAEVAMEPAAYARLTARAAIHHLAGRERESLEALERLEVEHADDSAFQIAAIRAVRGEADLAFAWLEKGFEQRDAGLAHVWVEPSFESIHGDPRWSAFIEKMGFTRQGSR